MSTLTPNEINALENCPNEDAWDALCLQIKKAHNGYPQDWYPIVIAPSGIMKRLEKRWNKPGAFDISCKPL